MTICISVLSNERHEVIVLADRMITSIDQTLAFEHDEPKIEKLFDNCVALTAGQATLHQQIFRGCKTDIRDTTPLINDVVLKLRDQYKNARKELMNDSIFATRGITIDYFYEMQDKIHESTIFELNNRMDAFIFPLDIIVAGVDDSSSHIYIITNPGIVVPLDAIGFACVGTGTRHAEVTFAYRKFSTSIDTKRALYISYEAKKRAEMAGGVGQRTDIAIISKKDGCKILSDNILDELEEIYILVEEKSGYGDEVDEAIGKLDLE